ncbi:hypothetical protein ACU610_12515 [Geodermatophilus sp. URMC 61]|uniref:hypothetical protein n=1 Tax=Geodermatophilus sp. URMC 61 TaxID=3423411 RepID=UPI00406D04AD
MSSATTHRGPALARVALVLCGAVATTTLAAPSALAASPAGVQVEPIAVTLDSVQIGRAPGTMVLSGTVACDTSVEAGVFGSVAQVQGMDIARDFFSVDAAVQCSSTPSAWTATSVGALRVFLPLPTTIDVFGQYCLGDICQTVSISETVTPAAAGPAADPAPVVDVAIPPMTN